jgi:hypothetical protein
MIVPNGTDPRDQGVANLTFVLFVAIGAYTLFTVSASAGALMLFAAFEVFRGGDFFTLVSLLCFSVLFVAIVETRKHWAGRIDLIYDGLLVVAGVNLVFQVLQYFGIWAPLRPIPGAEAALPGLMANPDEVFALYLMIIPVCFRRGRRKLLIPVASAGLLMASPLVSSAASYHVLDHIAGRVQVWTVLIKATMAHPVVGWGFVNIRVPAGGEIFREAHNEFVEWLFRGGIAGMCIALAFLGRYLREGYKNSDRVPFFGLVGACMAALAFFPWHITQLALITVVYLALIGAQLKGGNNA